jgi:hypothetical protein
MRMSSAPLPQHPDKHRPESPILLAVDQQLGEGPRILGFPNRGPIASTRSKSGSMRTWSSSARGADRGVKALEQGLLHLVERYG